MSESDDYRILIDDIDLKIYVINSNRVIVIEVTSWKRETVDKWVAFVRSNTDKLRSPVRMIYDLRNAGPPSQYFLDVVGPVLEELNLPDDIRTAHLFKPGPYERFAKSFIRRTPADAGKLKPFTDWDTAIAWLLATEVEP